MLPPGASYNGNDFDSDQPTDEHLAVCRLMHYFDSNGYVHGSSTTLLGVCFM